MRRLPVQYVLQTSNGHLTTVFNLHTDESRSKRTTQKILWSCSIKDTAYHMKYAPCHVLLFAGVMSTFLRDSAEVFSHILQGYFNSWALTKSLNPLTHMGPLYLLALTLIPAYIDNCIHHEIWDEITNPFPNWMSHFIPHFIGDVMQLKCECQLAKVLL